MKLKGLLLVLIAFFVVAGVNGQGMPAGVPDTKGYTIGPGDQVSGKILGEEDYDFVATVDEDGMIEVPFFDQPVAAKCRTERELRGDITTLLSKYLRNPQLSLRVTERKSRPPASIYGEVNKMMEITLQRKATLVEVLAIAGGVTEEAGGRVQVFRTRQPVCTDSDDGNNWKSDSADPTDVPSRSYSLASVKLGKEDANPIILPGDVVVVEKALPVYITGEVVSAQGIYLKEGGTSLSEAIAKVGGVRREAKTKDIKIYRLKPGATPEDKDREVIAANLNDIKKGLQKDIILQPYDVVEVDKAKASIGATLLQLAIGSAKQVVAAGSSSIGYRVLY